ncbi:MAG: hypothetical protein AAF902_20370, partial [Chloroflexota bacterium]
GISNSLRFFEPPRITDISPTGVLTGRSEPDYICSECEIDLYLDNVDEFQDALVYLGSVDADADGNFTYDLGQPLPADLGIRTMATLTKSGVISGYSAGTTTEASQLYTPITDITFDGPTEGFTGTDYQINFAVEPVGVSLPISYSVSITDEPSLIEYVLDDRSDDLVYKWFSPGNKTIEVTADNGINSMTKSFNIAIAEVVEPGSITNVIVTGPTTAEVGEEVVFDIEVAPADASLPIEFTINATDSANPVGGTINSRFATYTRTWTSSGIKMVEVTADNGVNQFTTSVEITIGSVSSTPTPSASSTPSATSTPSASTTPSATSTPSSPSTPSATGTPDPASSGETSIFLPMIQR